MMSTTFLNSPRLAAAEPGPAPAGWRRHASPRHAFALAGRLRGPLLAVAAVLWLAGLWIGLGVAPTDHQQGEAYRIIFVHVPAAWLSMVVYLAMAFWAVLGWVLNTRVSFVMVRALAPTGALLTALALLTGALWGQPTWGTWWVWDARLTSELLLLFLYVGVLALQSAIEDERRADRAVALLSIVGALNVPVIYFSVKWWNTLHQGASIKLDAAPSMAGLMLLGLLLCTAALWAQVVGVVLGRFQALLVQRLGGLPGEAA
jgi:heme exporter protein C